MSSELYDDDALDELIRQDVDEIMQSQKVVKDSRSDLVAQQDVLEARCLLGLNHKSPDQARDTLSLPFRAGPSLQVPSRYSSSGSSSQSTHPGSLSEGALHALESSCTDYDDDDLFDQIDDSAFQGALVVEDKRELQQPTPSVSILPSGSSRNAINPFSLSLSSSPSLSPNFLTGSTGSASSSVPRARAKAKGLQQSFLFGACAPQNVVAGKKWERADSSSTASIRRNCHVLDQATRSTWIYPNNLPKRDYQYNIVRYALFNNTFVSLPTGLGKTFIAAVVMYNYHRWFPQSKIVFMAPTRPLVAQQIEACYTTVGFGPKDTIELTGRHRPDVRAKAYSTKKVFFMTAETVRNDLEDELISPKDISLVIFDEAHRSSGNSAYCQVVRFLESKNIYHRILALSATPANSAQAVQSIIDNLHIGHIEMRSEKSQDLAIYRNSSQIENIVIQPSREIIAIRNMWAAMMAPNVKTLFAAKLLHDQDPVNIRSYSIVAARQQLQAQKRSRGENAARPGHNNQNLLYTLMPLEPMARAMNYLCEQGINKFAQTIGSYQDDVDEDGKKTSHGKMMVAKGQKFKHVIELVNKYKADPHYLSHPKLAHLQNLLIQHFASADEAATRVMIFAEFRDTVQEVLDLLETQKPMLRPVRFVGQSSGKTKGMTQADQESVMQAFRSGEYNVLVATCIGEEGLDIGQVDLVVTYDMKAAPIRMLQRQGRTGRKRAGRVVNLLSPGFEERSATKAEDKYEAVQKAIERQGIELYDDCPALLPSDCRPQPVEQLIPIEPKVKEELKKVRDAAEQNNSAAIDIDSDDAREARRAKKAKSQMKANDESKQQDLPQPWKKTRRPQPKAVRRAPVPADATGFISANDIHRYMLGSTQ